MVFFLYHQNLLKRCLCIHYIIPEKLFGVLVCCLSAIPSDLMKSTAVDESLSSMNQQFCSRENQLLQMLQQNEKSTQTFWCSSVISASCKSTSYVYLYLPEML